VNTKNFSGGKGLSEKIVKLRVESGKVPLAIQLRFCNQFNGPVVVDAFSKSAVFFIEPMRRYPPRQSGSFPKYGFGISRIVALFTNTVVWSD